MAASARKENGAGDQIAVKTLRRNHSGNAAITLIECLTYIALFFVVAGLAFAAYYRMEEETRGLSRNAGDISAALRAGERWRADLRLATVPLQIENGSVIRIAQKTGEVRYEFRDGAMWRQSAGQPQPILVLERVKSSSMRPDRRQRVTAWRWELELQTRRVQASVRPLFTFIGVPGTEVAR